jgi:signal transduction histidine kinase
MAATGHTGQGLAGAGPRRRRGAGARAAIEHAEQDERRGVAELQAEIGALRRQLAEAHEQQTATAEILRVIASSPADLQRVLDDIVAAAARLCAASDASIRFVEGGDLVTAATFGVGPPRGFRARRAAARSIHTAVRERRTVQVPDLLASLERDGPAARAGIRAVVHVPLLREGRAVGVVTVRRPTPGAFTDREVSLLEGFADQAVIAIQNARLFRALEQQSHALAEASRHKSQFLASMSHELRTPLNAILGYAELIVDEIYGPVPEKIRDVLERVQKSGQHLRGLINAVLDLSKIEAGQLVLALDDYSLEEVVQTVYTAVEPLAAEKGLALRVAAAPDLPAGRGDSRRVNQVLLNLVGNAIKFTDAGAVTIRAAAEDGEFVVSVHDTGPGIAEADQQRIFEEFQQVDGAQTRQKGGTGLGLAIARRIVELHGGRIWVDSQPGAGATFSFTLPVRVERQRGDEGRKTNDE